MPTRGTGKNGSLATSKLDAILHARRMKRADLARRLRIHRSTIGPWFNGGMPRSDTIQEIAQWSDGVIDPGDWFKPPEPQTRKPRAATYVDGFYTGGGKSNYAALLARLI